jgi:hypothetical protein
MTAERRRHCLVSLMIAACMLVVGGELRVGDRTLFDVRREAFLYSLLRSCLAVELMRTRSPTLVIPMSLRWVWSSSMRFSPLMWLSVQVSRSHGCVVVHLRLNSSTYWLQLMRFSQSATLSSSQCLHRSVKSTRSDGGEGTYRTASGAS